MINTIKRRRDNGINQRTAWIGRSPLPRATPTHLGPPPRRPQGTVATGYDAPPLRGTNAALTLLALRIGAAALSMKVERQKTESCREKAMGTAQSPVSDVLRHGFAA